MKTNFNDLMCIIVFLLAIGNLLAFINHCRNNKKIKTLEMELKNIEDKLQIKFDDINDTFNNICVDASINDNDIKKIKELIGYKDPYEKKQFANCCVNHIRRFFKSNQWTYEDFEAFTSIPISIEILNSGIESYIEDAIKKALQVSENILYSYAEEYARRLDDPDPIVTKTQAESLPQGWIWVECSYEDDFDIHLEDPTGNCYFDYDIMTGEYKLTSDADWEFYLKENYETGKYERASLSEFKVFAEKYIKENILNTVLDIMVKNTKTQAKTLPEGWLWIDYNDTSGELKSPDGKGYFSYYWSAGEYQITEDDDWVSFLKENYETGEYPIGSFKEFKTFAEKYVKENILNKE